MEEYFHSVILNEEKCLGCTNCVRSCPTQAIRVRKGKAVIIKEKCIDCGECIKVCPHHAKDGTADTMDQVKEYKYRVAVVDPAFLGQISDHISINAILSAIKELGFDEVREAAYSAEILGRVLNKELEREDAKLPLISSACPAIVRLIQVRFPELTSNIVPLESPMEVEARVIRKEYQERGIPYKDLGIFFLSPCPAKITSIKRFNSTTETSLNGALAIKDIYMDVLSNIKNLSKIEDLQRASSKGINWARSGGESSFISGACYIVVDGIQSVIRVLEQIERGKLDYVVFFEGLACRCGCVGGALNIENNFIAKQRIYRRTSVEKMENRISQEKLDEYYNSGILHQKNPILPRPMPPLDPNIEIAIKLADQIENVAQKLPGLDCSACGSPTCLALAEDIVLGPAEEVDCIFILREEIKNLAKTMIALSEKVPPVSTEKKLKKEEEENEG